MKIVPYLSQNKQLIVVLVVCAAIAGTVYAGSKKTVYSAYTYFSEANTGIILKDPQLLTGRDRSSFSVTPAERGSKIFKVECQSVLGPDRAASDLRILLENAHAWQKFVKVDPIRHSTTVPNRFKFFLSVFIGLCVASIGAIFVWERRHELFYEDNPELP